MEIDTQDPRPIAQHTMTSEEERSWATALGVRSKHGQRKNWRLHFLRYLAQHPNPSAAAKAAGVTPQAVSHAKERSPTFAQAYDRALNIALDGWEQTLEKRAMEGNQEEVWYKGKHTGDRRAPPSDILAMFMLKRYRPEFREAFTISGDPDNPLHTVVLVGTERNLKAQAQLVDGESKRLMSPKPESE